MNNPAEIFASLLRGSLDSRLDDVHVSMPGRIESYDSSKQKASVQPLIKRGYRDERGERVSELLPIVHEVPVEFFGGGDYALTFPVVAGMTCRLQFCSASLDRWLVRGGEVDPEDDRRFALTDAVAVVGLRDFAHALSGLPSNAWVMAAPTGAQIKLGSVEAFESAIKGNAFHTALSTYVAAINTFAGTCTTTPPGTSAALATAGSALLSALTAALSTKVKLE